MKRSNRSLSTALILGMSSVSQLIRSNAADGGIAGPISDGLSSLVPPITGAFGSAEISMELYRYEYVATTSYRGVNSFTTWLVQVNNNGKTIYTRNSIMTGVENPINTSSHNPFEISIGGSEGDVPFSVRTHKCTMPMGNGEFFQATTDAKITFKATHHYKVNPAHTSSATDAKITCSNWDRERSSCGEVYGKSTEIFMCQIANNGTSYPSIPNGNPVNLTHRDGAGLGITW